MTPNRRQFLRSSLALTLLAASRTSVAAEPDVVDLGSDMAYRRLLDAAKGERRANVDSAAAARVRRIGNRLVAASVAVVPDARNFAWAFNLLGAAEPDVQVFPNGRVFVTDALAVKTGFNDAEFAAIVAHALAHAILGHDAKRYAPAVAAKATAADVNRRTLDAADVVLDVHRRLRYDREEIEAADRTSVELLWRAVYDPRSAPTAWRRLASANAGIVDRIPVDDSRLAALEQAARGSAAQYEAQRAKAEELARSAEERRRQMFIRGQRERGQPVPMHLEPSITR